LDVEMDKQPEMLDFVKAMSDADRLRMIGVLTKGPARIADVAAELGIPVRDALNHLAFLEFVGAVTKADEIFSLNPSGLEALSKRQFAGGRETYVPAPDLDAKSRKVLVTYLNSDGSIKQIPQQASKLRVLLDYLVTAFTPGMDYTEKEVNTLLRRFHEDVSGLRRDLIDSGLMARESNGSRYWRV
jgi:hypothetical protein